MKNHNYYVYIMASNSRVIYIGVTNDLRRRVAEHKSGEIPGFSSKYKTHKLVYYEDTEDVGEAISREKELKGWRREKKVVLIEENNLRWADLAEDVAL